MANEKGFAAELNELITRYINVGSDPQEIIDELTREANLIFARHNLEIYLVARDRKLASLTRYVLVR
jgi:hypothetical protein